jgi:hypothetical protein
MPYSNVASFLALFAPSHRAHTTDIVGSGGVPGDYNPNFGGTSAACPYAAGAVAALQSAAQVALGRFLSPAEVRHTLTTTGDLVTDTKTPVTKPRVNLGRAIETLGRSGSFTIFNDGNALLNVTSIALDSAAPWLSWAPPAPFSIAPGNAQIVALSVNASLVPAGETTRRLLVTSDDSDESPYPGGVFIIVTNGVARPTLHGARVANRFVLSWSTNATGFALQSANALLSTGWNDVSGNPVVVGDHYYVTNTITGEKRFYRLEK